MTTKQLYSVNEFCQLWNVSRTDFYRQIQAGKLSILKRGRRSFISRETAENWMASLQRVGGAQ